MQAQPAVVVLAAGQGSRFGGPVHKLGQPFGGASVLAATLRHALASRLSVVVVTTETLAGEACRLVASRDVIVVPEVGAAVRGANASGMGSSIAAGVSARPDASGWLILPADMPLVRPSTLEAVALQLSHYPVAYAQHRGRRGHPVGFAAELYSELALLQGDEGARRLIARYPAHGVEIDDPGVLIDIDTQADLLVAQAMQTGAEPNAIGQRP
jgi:molybdenum cofactor cytidylyltransferase